MLIVGNYHLLSVAKLVCSRVRLKALVNGVASQIFRYRAGGFDGLR